MIGCYNRRRHSDCVRNCVLQSSQPRLQCTQPVCLCAQLGTYSIHPCLTLLFIATGGIRGPFTMLWVEYSPGRVGNDQDLSFGGLTVQYLRKSHAQF